MKYTKTVDGFTFSVYDKDSPFGEFGPIRYINDVQFKAKVPQYWSITVEAILCLGSTEIPLKETYIVKSKAKLSELDTVIEKYFNDTLSSYTDTFYKRLDELGTIEKPRCRIKQGHIEAWVLKPMRTK